MEKITNIYSLFAYVANCAMFAFAVWLICGAPPIVVWRDRPFRKDKDYDDYER